MKQKKVRMLLRVSSDQQLEADGDLTIQRAILKEYISKHNEWELDSKEYFEGSKSAYKNTAEERDVLQEILEDARNHEFDILVPYKDDRVGRLMMNTTFYIVNLKKYHVDVFTVKDGCISPKTEDDIEGIMMLVFRYANAQKSSKDTGMRVKDTAQKLVQRGKFMGGCAPYGYKLEYSNEISKHGRALKHLVVVSEQAEVVKYIYSLSLNKEFGSAKIAKTLNLHERFKNSAPNDVWRSSTITSILTNPIYTGYTAYKRRERINGKYHRLNSKDWILSHEANENLTIIDVKTWNKVQEKRKQRGVNYVSKPKNKSASVIRNNSGILALIDVLYCGYCGGKMVNGNQYNYWTIKRTGERKASKIAIYRCQTAWQGIPHNKTKQYRADKIEPIIFKAISEYIEKIQENEDILNQIESNQNAEKEVLEKVIAKKKKELMKIQEKIEIIEQTIPNAMLAQYPLSLKDLISIRNKHKEQWTKCQKVIQQNEADLQHITVDVRDVKELREQIPTWQDVFFNTDTATKRVLIDKLIDRIDIRKTEIIIHFKINPNAVSHQPRISDGFAVPKSRL